jgi:hypothetical protein
MTWSCNGQCVLHQGPALLLHFTFDIDLARCGIGCGQDLHNEPALYDYALLMLT